MGTEKVPNPCTGPAHQGMRTHGPHWGARPGWGRSMKPWRGLHCAHLPASSLGVPGCHVAGLGPSWTLGSADRAWPWESAHSRKRREEGTGRGEPESLQVHRPPQATHGVAFTLLVWEMGTNSCHTFCPWTLPLPPPFLGAMLACPAPTVHPVLGTLIATRSHGPSWSQRLSLCRPPQATEPAQVPSR